MEDTQLLAGEQNLEARDASKSHVKFGGEDENDVRKNYHRKNQKMINIYLKTPYKVLTINEIKNKEKLDKERGLYDQSPNAKLFIAENNLKLHTLIREKNNYATAKSDKFRNLINIAGEDENLKPKTYYGSMAKDTSISHLSENQSKIEMNRNSNENLHELDSQAQISFHEGSEANLI